MTKAPPKRVRSLAVWMLQCTEKCSRASRRISSLWTEHYKDSLTQFEGLRVLPVFWYSAFSGENPPRPMKLNDVSVVPCDRCGVFDSVTGRALMFFFFFF